MTTMQRSTDFMSMITWHQILLQINYVNNKMRENLELTI